MSYATREGGIFGRGRGVFAPLAGLGDAARPLSQLTRQFPWISPGEILDDGAYSYRVTKRWPGGVRLALYDRGGIEVDNQDFFEPGTSGMGDAAARASGLQYGGIFGAPAGVFGPMGAPSAADAPVRVYSPTPMGASELFPTLPGQPSWGIFSPHAAIFGPMGARPGAPAPAGYAFGGLAGPLDPTSLSVTVIQRGLVVAGTRPAPGSVDGVWGPATEASLREWVAANAGRLGADPARVLATFRDVPRRSSSVTLPNALASRLEQLSGQYTRGAGGGAPAPTPSAPAPTPEGPQDYFAPPGDQQTDASGKPIGPSSPYPEGASSFSWSGYLWGAPVWLWGAAGVAVLGAAALLVWSGRRRRPAPAAVAANRRRGSRRRARRRRARRRR